MGKLAGNEDEDLATGAVVVEVAGTLADGAEAIVGEDDDGVAFAQGDVAHGGFVRADEGRDEGGSVSGSEDAVVLVLTAGDFVPTGTAPDLMAREGEEVDVADGIVEAAFDQDAAHGEQPGGVVLTLPTVGGVVVHIVDHGAELAATTEAGLVEVFFEEGVVEGDAGGGVQGAPLPWKGSPTGR